MATITKREKIEDFGQKIGGAKKDLAYNTLERLKLITDDALTVQPLSKVFPRPDFQRLYKDGNISAQTAICLTYLYNSIPVKPRVGSFRIARWVEKVKPVIEYIRLALENNPVFTGEPFLQKEEYLNFRKEMTAANWPEEDYTPYPFRIIFPHQFSSTKKITVAKGRYIKFQSFDIDECIQWIRENTGSGKQSRKMQFSLWHSSVNKNYFITPKGKKGIRLKDFPNREEALEFFNTKHGELVDIYNELRNVHQGRRDWNRPRVGNDYRDSSDMVTEKFSSIFPFRGVEFGNWVTQIERAANLNEAYDAFCDLASVLGINCIEVTLNRTLAMAFGARGSGNAAAHYEHVYKVFNLTKKKGAGNVAHEWFHAFDNYICTLQGNPLSYASESPCDVEDEEISQRIKDLIRVIGRSEFKTRSEKIDEYKSKKYWSTNVELTARAFETYIVKKLKVQGCVNDYLANVMTPDEYPSPDVYPYPTDAEVDTFMPYYDRLMQSVFEKAGLIKSIAV